MRKYLSALILGAAVLCLAGCTEKERAGFSTIPQNSPASWELQPYGPLRN